MTEGEFAFEVGHERFTLMPGDSLIAPCQVPHVWTITGEGHGKTVIALTPAGQMGAFFREVMKAVPCRRRTRSSGARTAWSYSGRRG